MNENYNFIYLIRYDFSLQTGMKKINKTLKSCLLIFIATASSVHFTNAQNTSNDSKSNNIEQHIKNKDFVFVAQTALPTNMRSRSLTSAYDFKITNDSLVSSLPFFGRAYSPPLNPLEGGYNFVSTQFSYTIEERKKGGWNIVAIPKDRNNGEKFLLTVFKNGSASLQVTSNNRQPISFFGYVKE